MSTTRAMQARQRVLGLLEQAQTLILQAREIASPLQGWAEEEPRGPYYRLGDHYDATKDLWHEINNAPVPTGHDHDETFAADLRAIGKTDTKGLLDAVSLVARQPLDLKRSTSKEG